MSIRQNYGQYLFFLDLVKTILILRIWMLG